MSNNADDAFEGMCIHGPADQRFCPDCLKVHIARLRVDKAELLAALEPFARQIEAIECTTDHAYADSDHWPVDDDQVVKIGDLRRASAAVAKLGREK